MPLSSSPHILLTVDVEDWFQVENFRSCFPLSTWPSCELRVEANTLRLLDLLDSLCCASSTRTSGTQNTPRATFFVLGWLAARMPSLVREIHRRGHEVASHGYYHNLCNQCSPEALRSDLADSKRVLEDILGVVVHGYRAPNFSISNEVLQIVKECGYQYDSSFNSFSGNSRHGKIELTQDGRGIACELSSGFYEIPISNIDLGRYTLPMGGGGYFRLIPLRIFIQAVRFILKKQNAYLFYLHPWEIDPAQPRVDNVPRSFKFRHYVNMEKSYRKLSTFMQEFEECRFITCSEYLSAAEQGL